ncbi:MAG: hypothetical protein FJ123_04035 [Deltaproteobacteria bacterium]|nr:hypothetical protein [Deltaproteobacteria bacterium]
MPLNLRIPFKKDDMIKKATTKIKKPKTPFILEAIDEKIGLVKEREQIVREFSGWLSHEEAQELRKAVEVFNKLS